MDDQPTPILIKKLASPSALFPLPKFENIRPFFRININGEWQTFPALTNQRINRALLRTPLSGLSPTFPPRAQTIISIKPISPPGPQAPVAETKVSVPVATAAGAAETVASPALILEIESLKNQLTEKEIRLSEKEVQLSDEREREKTLFSAAEAYRQQIENLQQKNLSLTGEIKEKGEVLSRDKELVNSLSLENEVKMSKLQELETRLVELKRILNNSQALSADLGRKLALKEERLASLRKEEAATGIERGKAMAEGEALRSLIKNLRQALANARSELEKLKTVQTAAVDVQAKEEEIEKLNRRLTAKEQEMLAFQKTNQQIQEKIVSEETLLGEMAQLKSQMAELTQRRGKDLEKVKTEEAELAKLGEAYQKEIEKNNRQAEKLSELERFLEQLQAEKGKLAAFIDELSAKLSEVENRKRLEQALGVELVPREASSGTKPKIKITKVKPTEEAPSAGAMLSSIPNVLSGVVRDKKGKLLQNCVVIVKDAAGRSLRGLRTNELGQFLLLNPLPSGVYRIEVDKEGHRFDIIEIELTGRVLPTLKIVAH